MGLHLIQKRTIRIQQLFLGEIRVMDKLAEAAPVLYSNVKMEEGFSLQL